MIEGPLRFVRGNAALLCALCLPAIREKAHGLGYTVAIFGSMQRDFDLVAIPWDAHAVEADEVAAALAAIFDTSAGQPTQKLHGRLNYVFGTIGGVAIDLSVMPRGAL